MRPPRFNVKWPLGEDGHEQAPAVAYQPTRTREQFGIQRKAKAPAPARTQGGVSARSTTTSGPRKRRAPVEPPQAERAPEDGHASSSRDIRSRTELILDLSTASSSGLERSAVPAEAAAPAKRSASPAAATLVRRPRVDATPWQAAEAPAAPAVQQAPATLTDAQQRLAALHERVRAGLKRKQPEP